MKNLNEIVVTLILRIVLCLVVEYNLTQQRPTLFQSPVRLYAPTDNRFPQRIPAQGWSWSMVVGSGSRHKGRIQSSWRMSCDGRNSEGKRKRWIERGDSSRIIRGPKYRALGTTLSWFSPPCQSFRPDR